MNGDIYDHIDQELEILNSGKTICFLTLKYKLSFVFEVLGDTDSLIIKQVVQNRTEHNFIDIKLRPLTGSVRARHKNKAYT